MFDKLVRIAARLEAEGEHELADRVDDVLIRIATKDELNPFADILTQQEGRPITQLVNLELQNTGQSYRGQGASQRIYNPDIRRNPRIQELLRIIYAPIDYNLSTVEQQRQYRLKQQAEQEYMTLVAQMQGASLQSQYQPSLLGRGTDIARQRLQYLQNIGQTMFSNPYQTGWFSGQAPAAYSIGPQIIYPWMMPQAIPHMQGQYPYQYNMPFAPI